MAQVIWEILDAGGRSRVLLNLLHPLVARLESTRTPFPFGIRRLGQKMSGPRDSRRVPWSGEGKVDFRSRRPPGKTRRGSIQALFDPADREALGNPVAGCPAPA